MNPFRYIELLTKSEDVNPDQWEEAIKSTPRTDEDLVRYLIEDKGFTMREALELAEHLRSGDLCE